MPISKGSTLKLLAVVSTAVCLLASGQSQTFNLFEGQGVLQNNWQDWSWCSDSFNDQSYIYEGSNSVKITFGAAWQGFHMVSAIPFPAGYFSALRMTINGGTSAGRVINFSLDVNGSQTKQVNLNAYIQGGTVQAATWSNVTVPLSAFGIRPTDTISGFTLQEGSGSAQPSFWLGYIGWVPNPSGGQVQLTVNAAKSLRTVDPKMFGVNTAIWDSGFTSSANIALLKQSQFKAFRFPAGSLSDEYDWKTATALGQTWATNFDQFASYAAKASAGQCFITANYGTGTPAQAAAWVKYSNMTKKYGFKYWEVGNEVYGTWEKDSHVRANDPKIYATQFVDYYKQMKAANPSIQVGAVATPGEDAYANYSDEAVTNLRTGKKHSGWTAVMLATMASLKVTPDFLIYHRYPEYVNDCDFTLLLSNSGWISDMADLRQQLKDYLGTANTKTQIMCTENNCDAGPEGKQMCSLVNGIYMADTFGTVLQTECNSFLWWDWINGTNTTGDNGSWLYGWRMYGDEGVVSPDFTQTYPCFWMEQVLNLFAASGDQVLPTTSSYGLLTAFATKHSDGKVRLMVVRREHGADHVRRLHSGRHRDLLPIRHDAG
jgi:hypothetical protein